MARTKKDDLRFLRSQEKPYLLEWEAVDEPKPRKAEPRTEEPLLALRRAEEVEL